MNSPVVARRMFRALSSAALPLALAACAGDALPTDPQPVENGLRTEEVALAADAVAVGRGGEDDMDALLAAPQSVARIDPRARVPSVNPYDEDHASDHLTPQVARTPVPALIEICRECLALPPSCKASDLQFTRFPLDGDNGKNWMINNYLDLDPASAKLDFLGFTGALARNYEGHRGVDIDLPSFREMDSGTAVVRASAAGKVTDLREDQFDRNTSCTGQWNFVEITHANGFVAFYGHLKKASVTVQEGDYVQVGDILGVAGSSGCSTQAHLHFEVRDCNDMPVETFDAPTMWANPPAYHGPSDVMDVMLRGGAAPSTAQIKDPAPNVKVLKPGSVLGVGLSLAGRQGDEVLLVLVDPDGLISGVVGDEIGGNARFRHMFPAWSMVVGTKVGKWSLRTYLNGTLRATHKFGISNYDSGLTEVAKHHVSKAQFQTVFDDITAAGYMPVWVDGYAVNGLTYFNAIFRPSNGSWVARHNRTAAQYQAEFDYWVDEKGYRAHQVENYPDGGGIRYAVIFIKKAGPLWTAYHGLTAADHQDQFDSLTAAGYRPRNLSVVSVAGARFYTALYEKTAVGSWQAKSFLGEAAYQQHFDDNAAAGLSLRYLNAYNHNGAVRFSAIWTQEAWPASQAQHHMSVLAYQASWLNFTGQGYLTRFVTGYERNNSASFGALWAK